MIFRFLDLQLDTAVRELRRREARIELQPRVYGVLEYLVRHRGRVVSKEELLREVWSDVVVSDSSLQRAVSLARSALGEAETIRTLPRHGYRFVAQVEEQPTERSLFQPSFARSGDIHVAYHTLGDGDLDLVIIPGWVFPVRALLDQPEIRDWLQELARFGRVVVFDKRGTGLSDRVKELPTLEQRVDDLRAVLDTIGSRRAVLIGASEGGPLALVYAASFPERVHGLVLCSSFARWSQTADYPHGWTPEFVDGLRQYIAETWGRGDTIRAVVESRSDDPAIVRWAARAEQEGASPGAARELLEMNLGVDVRDLLPCISVPTVVFHQRHDSVIPVDCGRDLAERIPGARWVETEGTDHMPFFQGREAFFETLAWLADRPSETAPGFLTTILALRSGADQSFAGNDAEVRSLLPHFGAIATGHPGTWTFDGPQRAIRCGRALVAAVRAAGRPARVGIHIGEVERRGDELRGDAIDVAHAISRRAEEGEVWVARVVRDLVHGSDLGFQPRGEVDLVDGRTVGVLAVVEERAGPR